MRDGVALAERGVPVVVLVTEDFRVAAAAVARAAGMPDVPIVVLPHPMVATGETRLRAVAEEFGPLVAERLKNR